MATTARPDVRGKLYIERIKPETDSLDLEFSIVGKVEKLACLVDRFAIHLSQEYCCNTVHGKTC